MNLFRVRGIQLSVHFSFFLLLAINAYAGWTDGGGFTGAWWHTAVLLAFFACIVLHEFGHSFTALHYGIGVRRIVLTPIGGMALLDEMPRQPRRELLITLAGPAVNFAIAAVLWLMLPELGDVESNTMTLLVFGHLILQGNVLMGAFNLLPAFPMDGGRILRALLATRLRYLRATFWAATTGKVLCGIGILAAAMQEPMEGMIMLLFGFIFFMGEQEYRIVQRRELEEARLRASLAERYAMPPLLEEPPLLHTR